jgi:hypothetical protein
MEGLGEVLHKLSNNVEQMSAKIDRQSSNMEQMSSEIDSRLEELEDQMAAIQGMQAAKASSHEPLAACARTSSSPLPKKFEHKGESGWEEKNETYPIREHIRSFLVAPSRSVSFLQVSDRMTPSEQKQRSLNDLVLLRSYETSARSLLEREGRNEGRKEGGDFLSTPSPRYLEHVPPVAEVNGSSSNEYKTENVEDMLNDSNVEQKLTGIKSSLHFHQQNLQVRGGKGPSTHGTCACGMRMCYSLTARVHVPGLEALVYGVYSPHPCSIRRMWSLIRMCFLTLV